jgi:hypothetical protein
MGVLVERTSPAVLGTLSPLSLPSKGKVAATPCHSLLRCLANSGLLLNSTIMLSMHAAQLPICNRREGSHHQSGMCAVTATKLCQLTTIELSKHADMFLLHAVANALLWHTKSVQDTVQLCNHQVKADY